MTDITVKIGPKQGPSGITDDLAEQLHNKSKSSLIGVVELIVEERSERRDGKETVKLSITNFEPAVEQIGEDHLREFQRALHMNRKLHSPDDQPTLPDVASGIEPTVAEVIDANPGIVHHDYLPTTTGECEVCGHPEDYNLHRAWSVDDPFAVPDTDDPDNDDEDQADDDEAYDDGSEDPFTP